MVGLVGVWCMDQGLLHALIFCSPGCCKAWGTAACAEPAHPTLCRPPCQSTAAPPDTQLREGCSVCRSVAWWLLASQGKTALCAVKYWVLVAPETWQQVPFWRLGWLQLHQQQIPAGAQPSAAAGFPSGWLEREGAGGSDPIRPVNSCRERLEGPLSVRQDLLN